VYAYVDYKVHATQCVRDILANLVKQLCRSFDPSPVPKDLKSMLQDIGQKFRAHQIAPKDYVDFILRCAKYFPSVFILFDALDECDLGPRWKLLNSIKDIHHGGKNIKILITSRDHITLEHGFASHLSFDIKAHHSDLESFVRAKLEFDTHIQVPAKFKSQIVKELLSKADGTYSPLLLSLT
jgi:hypothetical protein